MIRELRGGKVVGLHVAHGIEVCYQFCRCFHDILQNYRKSYHPIIFSYNVL